MPHDSLRQTEVQHAAHGEGPISSKKFFFPKMRSVPIFGATIFFGQVRTSAAPNVQDMTSPIHFPPLMSHMAPPESQISVLEYFPMDNKV